MATIYSYTRDQLVERICKLILHDWKEGTATGGSTSTFVDTSRLEKDDYFQNTTPPSRIRIRTTTDGAAPQGEERELTDWVNSTWTGSVLPTFTVAPAAGDTYAILSEYTWDEVCEAINTAIDTVGKEALVPLVDENSVVLVSGVMEYPLPSGFIYVNRLTMSDENGDFDSREPIPSNSFVVVSSDVPKLSFIPFPIFQVGEDTYYGELWGESDIAASRTLRVEGLARQAALSSDLSLCSLNPNFVCYQAAALLHLSRIRRGENDPDEHAVQYKLCQERADIERAKTTAINLPMNSKRVRF